MFEKKWLSLDLPFPKLPTSQKVSFLSLVGLKACMLCLRNPFTVLF